MKEIIMSATNEIIKDFKDGFFSKDEALNRLEGVITVINHSDIEKSSDRMAIRKFVMDSWYKAIENK